MAEPGVAVQGVFGLVVLVLLTPLAAQAEPGTERAATLMHRLKHDCGSCHGMTLKGGLGPPLVPEAILGRTDADLVEAILHGIPGTPMPPWDFEITSEEAKWLVRQLKAGIHEGG